MWRILRNVRDVNGIIMAPERTDRFRHRFPISAFVVCRFEYSSPTCTFSSIGVALSAGTSAPLSVTEAVGISRW